MPYKSESYVERYVKYKNYIITILIESYKTWNEDDKELIDKSNSLYSTKEFKIKKIEDIVTKTTFNEVNYIETNYNNENKVYLFEVDKKYTDINIKYYYTYERAFIKNFIKDKQYLLFPNGYSGYFKEYEYNGRIIKEYYHINGMIYGIYKEYDYNGNINIECEYTNNKKNGKYIKYNTNKQIHIESYYNNDNLDKSYKVYNNNNILIYEAEYDNNTLLSYIRYHPYSGELIEKRNIQQ